MLIFQWIPVDTALPTSGHSSMYIMHKYFARKQEDVIREYIRSHTREGDLVLDPFCGSGVMVGEALRLNRRIIGIDVNPVAIFITRNTIQFIETERIIEEFKKIKEDVATDINMLYMTKCRDCARIIPAICFTWSNDSLIDVRYKCPKHGKMISQITTEDLTLQNKIIDRTLKDFFDDKRDCHYWYPTNRFYYNDGTPFLKKEQFNSVDEIFTIRNLISLAKLYSRIEKITDKDLQEAFKFAFTSMTHLASKMTPVRPSRPFSSAWVQQSYWYCPKNMESNVWNLFERSIYGKQGLIKAKSDIPDNLKNVKKANNLHQLIKENKHCLLAIKSSISFLEDLEENSIDYIITDPPYGHSIQYGELLFMWGAWLKLMDNFEIITQNEIIKNRRQHKYDEDYERMLSSAFKSIYRVLKPERYCTVTFHNPSLKYRNILYRSVILNGFKLEKIIYQPPPRPSAKSLLQPFGSLEGDYFFRFKKTKEKKSNDYELIDKIQLEVLIVNIAKQIILEQREPVHYTFIQNSLDPILYEKLEISNKLMNFQPEDIEKTLKKYIGKIFQLEDIEARIIGKKRISCKGWSLIDFRE
jgi:adenine-specific DNA methylase